MATPLYTFMKNKGTSFYCFPSASKEMNLDFQNPNYTVNFSKFVLLNFPKQIKDDTTPYNTAQERGVMNFSKYDEGDRFYCFQPGSSSFPGPIPSKFSDQMIESLRNYVANYDEVLRNIRINQVDDFYKPNIKETNIEKIFWKWCKKLNLIDFEPASHLEDWDKTQFSNTKANGLDTFQEYLWKEREIITYNIIDVDNTAPNILTIEVDEPMKIKEGDYFEFYGTINMSIWGLVTLTGDTYQVSNVNVYTSGTTFDIDFGSGTQTPSIPSLTCKIHYERFVKYVGEIQAQSKVETSSKIYTEVTATVYHHQGQTPNVLWKISSNPNYYPSLEIPILPSEIQSEILGAENLNSPIRLNPNNYPGSFYGIFDTADKTYICPNGDTGKKSGEYFGILKTNNIDVDKPEYFEKLSEWNSDEIDGLMIDFKTDDYLKMKSVSPVINNFDDFNSYPYNNLPPEDFEFNAILWYYEIQDGVGNKFSNLYGIEFLNNPNDDFDENDPSGQLMRPYQKLVSNGTQDGLSYTFNLNVNYTSDNDIQPLRYDPTTLNNATSFDLYQNILKNTAKLQENFMLVISGFTFMHQEFLNLKSLVYSQVTVEDMQRQIENLNSLLSYYSKMTLADSPTTKIQVDYNTGNYPVTKINVTLNEYDNIFKLSASQINNQNKQGNDVLIQIPTTNKILLIITNDLNDNIDSPLRIKINPELTFAQGLDIMIESNGSTKIHKLEIYTTFINETGENENKLLTTVYTPNDMIIYDPINSTNNIRTRNYYITKPLTEEISTIDNTLSVTQTYLYPNTKTPLFRTNDTIWIDNFTLVNNNLYMDLNGAYKIVASGFTGDLPYYVINTGTTNYNLIVPLQITSYKNIKINLLRQDSTSTSNVEERYRINKIINS